MPYLFTYCHNFKFKLGGLKRMEYITFSQNSTNIHTMFKTEMREENTEVPPYLKRQPDTCYHTYRNWFCPHGIFLRENCAYLTCQEFHITYTHIQENRIGEMNYILHII